MSIIQNCSIYHCIIIIHLVLPTREKEKNSRTSQEGWGFQRVNMWLKKKKNFFFCFFLVPGLSCRVWFRMWDLVSLAEITPGLPALGALSLNHWTTKEVHKMWHFKRTKPEKGSRGGQKVTAPWKDNRFQQQLGGKSQISGNQEVREEGSRTYSETEGSTW